MLFVIFQNGSLMQVQEGVHYQVEQISKGLSLSIKIQEKL